MSPEQIEEMTIQFLRDNCQFYHKQNRKKLMSHSYHTVRQTKSRNSVEIPLSSLSNKQKRYCPKLGDSLDYEER